MTDAVGQVFEALVRRMQEPLGLDRWTIKVESGPDTEGTASCTALPHYQTATLTIDPDKLQTGDAMDEFVAHELAHCHVWPIAQMADNLGAVIAELLPERSAVPIAKLLKTMIDEAEETTTTQVGEAYVRMLRRLWAAEDELKRRAAESTPA